MRDCSTPWHILAPLILLVGCSGSHTRDDCPDVIGTCMDACCENATEPSFDADCRASCPVGTRFVDRCAPDPSCATGDGGGCDVDAGPIAPCLGGPCCTDVASPDFCGPSGAECPAGFSWTCEPDPAARCPAPWIACERPSDCTIAASSCCIPCDEVTLDDVDGVNASFASAHRDAVCPEGAACPPCAPPPYPHLIATCSSAMQCEAIDLRAQALTACASDTECRLRVPDCCECGADTSVERLVAIRADASAALEALVCDPGSGCAECAPLYPTTAEAYCALDGHCAVRPVP